jgi:hypothetical protein
VIYAFTKNRRDILTPNCRAEHYRCIGLLINCNTAVPVDSGGGDCEYDYREGDNCEDNFAKPAHTTVMITASHEGSVGR